MGQVVCSVESSGEVGGLWAGANCSRQALMTLTLTMTITITNCRDVDNGLPKKLKPPIDQLTITTTMVVVLMMTMAR